MTSWHDPMVGYRKLQAEKAKKEKEDAYRRFVRERVIFWSLTFLGLGALALWVV